MPKGGIPLEQKGVINISGALRPTTSWFPYLCLSRELKEGKAQTQQTSSERIFQAVERESMSP